jgi:hypothetical protein
VAADQDHDVRDFAEQFDIEPAQAKRLIDRHCNEPRHAGARGQEAEETTTTRAEIISFDVAIRAQEAGAIRTTIAMRYGC